MSSEGQIDQMYIDPPFNTGEYFKFPNEMKIGGKNLEQEVKHICYVQHVEIRELMAHKILNIKHIHRSNVILVQ